MNTNGCKIICHTKQLRDIPVCVYPIRGKILFLFPFYNALYASSLGTNAVTMRFTTGQQILNWELVLCVFYADFSNSKRKHLSQL